MYEVSDIQKYRQKWLEAERDLAINWAEPPFGPTNYEPIDNVDKYISIEPCINKDTGPFKDDFIRSLKKVSRKRMPVGEHIREAIRAIKGSKD